ncbi:hypothetical protein [Pseudoxanthomonas sp. PXM04]|uniref:hypothetical protein n=1 Tax=Pseudoxanthomonas sp. PXM04 TaxID=2769297 RepID=UPI00177DBE2D|nr:hypothetical protein [Pseudoxanthomonas sp. PXM04]MBD9376177.1 hypothetical protein [Pseudoxanthomonas sp. PXM04]
MAVSCQFLSVDWGNVADWGGVVASVGVGIAVGFMTSRTNRLAAAANQTNAELAKLEAQRDQAAAALASSEKRIMLVSIETPLRLASAQTTVVLKMSKKADFRDRFADSRECRDGVERWVSMVHSVLHDSAEDRLHVLGDTLGARLARARRTPSVVLAVIERGNSGHVSREVLLEGANLVVAEIADLDEDLTQLLAASHAAMHETGIVQPAQR